jgi:flagellin-specific chaperone FliS
MEKQRVIKIAEELKAKWNRKASETLEQALKSVYAQRISELAIIASRREAKADALEELIERLEEEE